MPLQEVEEEGLSGSDDSSLEKEEERVGKSDVQAEDGNMKSGKLVTLAMIEKWVKNLDKVSCVAWLPCMGLGEPLLC